MAFWLAQLMHAVLWTFFAIVHAVVDVPIAVSPSGAWYALKHSLHYTRYPFADMTAGAVRMDRGRRSIWESASLCRLFNAFLSRAPQPVYYQ